MSAPVRMRGRSPQTESVSKVSSTLMLTLPRRMELSRWLESRRISRTRRAFGSDFAWISRSSLPKAEEREVESREHGRLGQAEGDSDPCQRVQAHLFRTRRVTSRDTLAGGRGTPAPTLLSGALEPPPDCSAPCAPGPLRALDAPRSRPAEPQRVDHVHIHFRRRKNVTWATPATTITATTTK